MNERFGDKSPASELVRLDVHNPTGMVEVVQAHAPRLNDLNGKTIAELSNGSWEAERTFPVVRELLQKRYPGARIIHYTEFPRGTGNVEQDATTDLLIEKCCDAVIVGNAACGSCSTAAGRAAAKAERRGIPSVAITRQGFGSIVDYAFSGLGFSAEAAKQAFPMAFFLADGDPTQLDQEIDGLVAGLTAWQPKKTKTVTFQPPTISIDGESYQDAVDKMNATFLNSLWGDGLPITPPTEQRVAWLLSGTDLQRGHVVGHILPRGGIATIETVAVAAAMAGCRPEYMPVLVAAMEAILDPFFQHQLMQTATGSNHPAVVVNGPVARQIRINSGYGCLGPSSVYPAGASIGRAIRFLLTNVGGAVPGVGAMSIHATPGKYTGVVFSEDEAGLPPGWHPLSADRGFARDANAVTVLSCSSSIQLWNGTAASEREVQTSLDNYANCMGIQHGAFYANGFNPEGSAGILLLARAAAQSFAHFGWQKDRITDYLWRESRLPDTPWLRNILDYFGRQKQLFVKDHIQYPMPIAHAPKNITIVVAGGDQGNHSFWLPTGAGIGPVTRKIVLPGTWNSLLGRAETLLGPIPAS
jgi:hypothetical protein